jgi:sRNA-binding carbon storage regulator CsrA
MGGQAIGGYSGKANITSVPAPREVDVSREEIRNANVKKITSTPVLVCLK